MTLALRLGRTLSELGQSLSASELQMWVEFDRQNPIGDSRGDIQAAQIASAIYGSQGAKVSLEEALLRWGSGPDEEKDPFAALEAALNAVAE